MNSQTHGALFVVRPKGVNALAICLGRVVVEMLLRIKHVLTRRGQICRLKNVANPHGAAPLRPLALPQSKPGPNCHRPRETNPSWLGGLYRAPLPHLHVRWKSQNHNAVCKSRFMILLLTEEYPRGIVVLIHSKGSGEPAPPA